MQALLVHALQASKAEDFNAAEMAMVLWGVARLGLRLPKRLLDQCVRRLRLAEAAQQHQAAEAAAGGSTGGDVSARIMLRDARMPARTLVTLLRALRMMDAASQRSTVVSLLSALGPASLASLEPKQLVLVLHAAAHLGCPLGQLHGLSAALCGAVAAAMPRFNAQDLSMALWALVQARVTPDAQLLAAAVVRAAQLQTRKQPEYWLPPAGLAQLFWHMGVLRKRLPPPLPTPALPSSEEQHMQAADGSAALLEASAAVPPAPSGGREVTAKAHAPGAGTAYAAVLRRPEVSTALGRLLGHLLQAQRLREWPCRDLAQLVWGLALCWVTPGPELLGVLMHAVTSRMWRLQSRELRTCLWGLAQMGAAMPDDGTLELVARPVLRSRMAVVRKRHAASIRASAMALVAHRVLLQHAGGMPCAAEARGALACGDTAAAGGTPSAASHARLQPRTRGLWRDRPVDLAVAIRAAEQLDAAAMARAEALVPRVRSRVVLQRRMFRQVPGLDRIRSWREFSVLMVASRRALRRQQAEAHSAAAAGPGAEAQAVAARALMQLRASRTPAGGRRWSKGVAVRLAHKSGGSG